MDFTDYLARINKLSSAERIITDYSENSSLTVSNAQKKMVQKGLLDSLKRGKFASALNYLIIGLCHDRTKTIDNIRRKGLLRQSKYLDRKPFLLDLIKKVHALKSPLGLSVEEIQYFSSIQSFAPARDAMIYLRKNILNVIVSFDRRHKIMGYRTSLVKTLVSYLDGLFLSIPPASDRVDLNDLASYTREDISEAISLIIFEKHTIFRHSNSDTFLVDDEFIASGDIEQLILFACKFQRLKEWEIFIDHFSYSCRGEDNRIVIESPDTAIEKSIQLGYIRTHLQGTYQYLDIHGDIQGSVPSIQGLGDVISNLKGLDALQLSDFGGYQRYKLEIPTLIVNDISEKIFNTDELFEEEIEYLYSVFQDQLLTVEEVKKKRIGENLTLWDYVKIKRFFTLLYYLFAVKLHEKYPQRDPIFYRSLVPTFRWDDLKELLAVTHDDTVLQEFMEVLVWTPEKEVVFDLQYYPILKYEDSYMVPLSVFVNSNTLRNVYASQHKAGNKHIFNDGVLDPVSNELESCFISQGFSVHKQISHNYKNGGDVDMIVTKDNFMLIVECKHSLHPTNVYELRTVYDYIIKANKQLDIILEAFIQPQIKVDISKSTGIDFSTISTIKSCIVLSNRLFSGCDHWNHPIRPVNEIIHFIESGTVTLESGKRRLWAGETLTEPDLSEYLNDQGKLYSAYFSSMEQRGMGLNTPGAEFEYITYGLDPNKAVKKFESLPAVPN